MGRVGALSGPADPRETPPAAHLVFSCTGENPSDRAGLPNAILLGRKEFLAEMRSDLAQRQPRGPTLLHHANRRLFGAVFRKSIVHLVEAERQMPGAFAPVHVFANPEAVYGPRTPAGLAEASLAISRTERCCRA